MRDIPKIKICGLRRKKDIDIVNRYHPEYVGFILAKSKIQVMRDDVKDIVRELDKDIKKVGVFVNQSHDYILSCIECGAIDMIQLHGDETEDYINEIKKLTKAPVIKAVRVKDSKDILRADKLSCDYLLFDAYKEGEYGGTGRRFSWDLIPDKPDHPFFLAGGLDPDVAKDASLTGCYALDVSSGVATDGYKDEDKVRAFIEAVRGNNI